MRLTTMILIASLMQVSAAGFAQKISLSRANVTLKSVLREIRTQSGYDFVYTDDQLSKAHRISLSVTNVQIDDVLKQIFKDQPLTYSINSKTVSILDKTPSFLEKIAATFAAIDVHGRLLDEKGNPLAGATVRVLGTSRIVTTNASGDFYLQNLDEQAILQFSFLGYETLEMKAKPNLGKITLSLSIGKLEEVTVSTGYQSILKERAPGSFVKLDRETLEKRPVVNLSSALQGLVAGMQSKENADGSVQLMIRGNSSLYADRSPLFVVDGFPIAGDLSSINPNDVESVTVLKDAAAASIWGARSGNGVIVVVTKKGAGNKGLNIDANVYTRISKLANLEQLSTQANSADQVAYERLAYKNGWFFNKYAGSFGDIGKPLTLAQELLFANGSGMNASLDSLSTINNRVQINDLLLQRAIQNQYNVNFSAATDRSKTYASLLFENNKTRYQGTGNQKYGMNFNNDFKITRFLNFNFGLNLQYNDTESSGATLTEIQGLSPYETLLNPDGSYAVNLKDKNRAQLALLPLSKFPYPDWSYNLLREVRGRNYTGEELSARIQTGFHLKIVKGLSFDTKLQYERRKSDYSNFNSEDTYYARDMINTMVEYNNTTKVVGKNFLPKGGIENSRKLNIASYVFRNQLNYVADFGTEHSINAVAGAEISQTRVDARLNPWQYGFFPEKLQSTVPLYGYGSTSDLFTNFQGVNTTLQGGSTTSEYRLDRFASYYANAAYTYDGKYTLSGSLRADASNFITEDPALRWSPLWSVGGLWNMRKESFMDNLNFIDQLNLRATYGKNGNVEKSSSTQAIISVSTAPSTTTGTITATITDKGNPSLRWEKTVTTNFGLDFSLFQQKLTGSLDVYNKIGKDITGVIALPAVTGTTSQRFNNAGITNRGIEIELGTTFKIPGIPVFYNTSVNYAYNKNTIRDLFSPVTTAGGYLDPSTAYVEGRAINPVYSFTYLGMLNGIPQVAGPNGTSLPFNTTAAYASALGLQFLNYEGTTTPPHTFGWLNNFKYRDFSLSVLVIGKMGGVYRNPTFNYSAYIGSTKTYVNKFVADVFAGNPDIPGFANVNESQLIAWDRYAAYLSRLVESSSYLECKEVMLDYSLPKKIASKLKTRNIRFFIQARDLGLLWSSNKNNYNPDWLPGTDRPLGTYTLGFNLKF